jgi:BirA family biotin operon repressor/biotin-[acetyl-CoA-carboxylase] ligase
VKIRDIAGSLRIEPGRRSLFAAALIGEVFSLYSRLTEAAYIMREYRERSLMEDREITVFRGGESTEAVSRGVADDGTLLVEYTDGTMENLRSGEVSIGIGGRGSP